MIYDIEENIEVRLPDIPNNVRVTNPFDGAATLLPLHPPDYVPEVLICGGTTASDQIPAEQLSSQDPASDQCIRMALTPEGIRKGWEIEKMLEPRIMAEMILVPNGEVVIINGAQTGYAAIAGVRDPVGDSSNSDHPAYVFSVHRRSWFDGLSDDRFTPSIYTPDAPHGQRINNKGMPSTEIARLYHSSVTLTQRG